MCKTVEPVWDVCRLNAIYVFKVLSAITKTGFRKPPGRLNPDANRLSITLFFGVRLFIILLRVWGVRSVATTGAGTTQRAHSNCRNDVITL